MDMLAYVRSKGKLTEREARPLFHQICAIVADFHSKGVVLNDIKLRKFFFVGSQRTKVSTVPWEDAPILENPQNDMLTVKSACPIYASPEILHKSTTLYSGRRHDCWCLGVILYTMLTGHYPFQDNNTAVLFAKIMKGQYEIPDYISPTAEFLIRSLLNRQPKERLTARAAMQDRWFTERDPFLEPGDLLPESQLLETDSYPSYTSRSPITYTITNSSYRTPANVTSPGSRFNSPPLLQLRYLPPNRLCSIKASLSISNDQIVPEMNNCQNKSDEIFHWTLTSGLLS